MLDGLKMAAKIAAKPTIRLGSIVGGDPLNGWSVQVPSHVDHNGNAVPMRGIRSLTNQTHYVGDLVYVARINGNRPREGALWVILDSTGQTQPPARIVDVHWWPRYRQSQQRSSAASGHSLLNVTSPRLLHSGDVRLLRADDQYVYSIGTLSNGEWLKAWPVKTPSGAYTAAWAYRTSESSTPVVQNLWTDKLRIGAWSHDTAHHIVVVNDTNTWQTTGDVVSLLEPIKTSANQYLVVTALSWWLWHFARCKPETFEVAADFTTWFDDWNVAPRMAYSSPNVSYPIYRRDDPFSELDFPSPQPAALITSSDNQVVVVSNSDDKWLEHAADERSNLTDLEDDPNANIGHIFSRGQLRVLKADGDSAWTVDVRTAPDVAYIGGLEVKDEEDAEQIASIRSYGGLTPLCVMSVDGREALVSHWARADFHMKPLYFPAVNYDVVSEMNALGLTDPHAFANTTWYTSEPAPPWSWKRDYIESRIEYYMTRWQPGFTTEKRDIQRHSVHGYCAHDLSQRVPFRVLPMDTQESSHAILDTGDALSTAHGGERAPRRCYNPDGTELVQGTAQSGTQSLRDILQLTSTQKVVCYLAVETYSGTAWSCWDKSFQYWFGTGPSFDSRFTSFPVYNSDNTFAFDGSAPYWVNEYDGITVRPFPYGDLTNGGAFNIGGNLTTGYHVAGTFNTFYTAHARYCLDYDASGNAVWNESTIEFVNEPDPLGNFDHYTTSIEYFAWVIDEKSFLFVSSSEDIGYNPNHVVSDGQNAYCLPAVDRFAEVLWLRNNLRSHQVLAIPDVVARGAAPAAVALYTVHGASVLYLWLRHDDGEGGPVIGTLYRIVQGTLDSSQVIGGSELWESASLIHADNALWLAGSGAHGFMVKIETAVPT